MSTNRLFPTLFFQYIVLLIILAIGTIFRLVNTSSYNFYPDAYQNLLVAINIKNYHQVIGFLGENGMVYPDFFIWTRPGYALFILLANIFTNNISEAAHCVSFFLGVLSILIAFLFVKKLFHSSVAGLVSAFLLSISFNHTLWSGFIMTETTGVFFMLLFLLSLFTSLEKPVKLANAHDFLTGALFAAAVVTRYEYILIVLPILYLLIRENKRPFSKIVTIFSSFLFCITLTYTQLFPLNSLASLATQGNDLLIRGLVIVCLVSTCILFFLFHKKKKVLSETLYRGIVILLYSVTLLLLVQKIFPSFYFLREDLGALRNFALEDFLLYFTSLIGITSLLKGEKKLRHYAIFALSSIIILGLMYHRINPQMQRYWTHTIPFLLIPSGFFGHSLLSQRSKFWIAFVGIVSALSLFQIVQSYGGIQYWKNGTYFRSSYEEVAAKKITDMYKKMIPSLLPRFLNRIIFFLVCRHIALLIRIHLFILINH